MYLDKGTEGIWMPFLSNQAEEEFNIAQSVFEEINKEMREELPVLYQR